MTAPQEHLEPQRRTLKIEIAVVLAVTFGLSAYTAGLRLVEAVLLGLSGQTVALNPKRSPFDLIDLGLHLAVVLQLLAWGALALYLLWRGRIRWPGRAVVRVPTDHLGRFGVTAARSRTPRMRVGIPPRGETVHSRNVRADGVSAAS